MKKVLSIIALSAMTLSLSSFTATTNDEGEDCEKLMNNVYGSYMDAGYDSDYSLKAAIWAYEGCAQNGGDPGLTIIVDNQE